MTINRFIRDYELVIGQNRQSGFVLKPPFQIVFSIDKQTQENKVNTMRLNIFNLNESNRLSIVKEEEDDTYLPIILKVGYSGSLETIFKGSIKESYVQRNGPDFINIIECEDGGHDMTYSFTSKTVRDNKSVINALIEDMPNTTIGKINQRKDLVRPKVLVGNTYQLFEKNIEDQERFYIDNEQVFIVKDNQATSTFIPVVRAETGLINTPEKNKDEITFQTIMNPALRIGQLCEIQSVIAPYLNGVYRINVISYKGDYEGDDWNQIVTCTQPDNLEFL